MADRKQANRIQWVDLAKGICMILVVWIHVRIHYRSFHFVKFNWVALVCYYFRMPLYFFLSGLFFKTYDSYRTFLGDKIQFPSAGAAPCELFLHRGDMAL